MIKYKLEICRILQEMIFFIVYYLYPELCIIYYFCAGLKDIAFFKNTLDISDYLLYNM